MAGFWPQKTSSRIAMVAVWAGIAAVLYYSVDNSPPAPIPPERQVTAGCIYAATNLLNDPDSADIDYERTDAAVRKQDDGTYYDIVHMRAKNGFNATIRTRFWCHAKKNAKGEYGVAEIFEVR